jgi:hypothetical protein
VTRDEYSALRDRLETLRIKARDRKSPSRRLATTRRLTMVSVPVGTEFDIKLQTSLNSGITKVEQRFEGTTILDYAQGRDIVVPAGSVVRGFVSSVRSAGKIDRKGSLTLSFDEIRIGKRTAAVACRPITQAIDPKIKGRTPRGSARGPWLARSLAASSAVARARCSASSSAAAGRLPRLRGRMSIFRPARSCASASTSRWTCLSSGDGAARRLSASM